MNKHAALTTTRHIIQLANIFEVDQIEEIY